MILIKLYATIIAQDTQITMQYRTAAFAYAGKEAFMSNTVKKSNIKKILVRIISIILILIILLGGVFTAIYFTRFQTISTIRKVTDYDDFNVYKMNVKYDYNLDNIIEKGITDDQSFVNAIVGESLPFLPISIKAPKFACSAFTMTASNGDVLMGRNYDFKNDSSALLVYCSPKDGYKSVATTALDNIKANVADKNIKSKLTCLTAPFICLDGMNEKGVSIAVLTLDSDPTRQNTGKQTIGTTLAIRLVLDKAASTQEAVDLLGEYDMFATSGRDYHFYITDSSGDGRVVEYDCNSADRKLTDTPIRTITNFYGMYIDKVQPNQKNGIYGHGKERYDKIEAVFEEEKTNYTTDSAWKALKAAAQLPNPEDVTSNTQWSIVYNDTTLTADIVLRRNWEDIYSYDLNY